jgi:hypothetical protein
MAIGDPNEKGAVNFGAIRSYCNDKKWRQNAEVYMEDASMIFVRISSIVSDGLSWELKQINKKHLNKTVFFIEINNKDDYSRFQKLMQQLYFNFLPDQGDLNLYGNYISFNENGKWEATFRLEENRIYKRLRAPKNNSPR